MGSEYVYLFFNIFWTIALIGFSTQQFSVWMRRLSLVSTSSSPSKSTTTTNNINNNNKNNNSFNNTIQPLQLQQQQHQQTTLEQNELRYRKKTDNENDDSKQIIILDTNNNNNNNNIDNTIPHNNNHIFENNLIDEAQIEQHSMIDQSLRSSSPSSSSSSISTSTSSSSTSIPFDLGNLTMKQQQRQNQFYSSPPIFSPTSSSSTPSTTSAIMTDHSNTISPSTSQSSTGTTNVFQTIDSLSYISHEIRTPLHHILYQIDEIKSELDKSDIKKAKMKGKVRDIEESVKQLHGLLNSVLDMSKCVDGKVILNQIDFNLPVLIEEICSFVSPFAKEKGIQIASYIYPHCPISIYGDPGRLRQVLFNLITNGVKYTERGQVTIKVESEVSTSPQQLNLRFEITDSGIGIKEEDIPRLFKTFSQLHEGKHPSEKNGHGLGLAIAKGLVEIMGGTLECTSKENEGTTFTVLLSFEQQQQQLHCTSTINNFKGLPVMVVDSNDVIRSIVCKYLTDWNCQVFECPTIEIASQKLEKNNVSVIYVDTHLSNQYEVKRLKRSIEKGAYGELKLVLVSSDRAFIKGLQLTNTAAIYKPIQQLYIYASLLLSLPQKSNPTPTLRSTSNPVIFPTSPSSSSGAIDTTKCHVSPSHTQPSGGGIGHLSHSSAGFTTTIHNDEDDEDDIDMMEIPLVSTPVITPLTPLFENPIFYPTQQPRYPPQQQQPLQVQQKPQQQQQDQMAPISLDNTANSTTPTTTPQNNNNNNNVYATPLRNRSISGSSLAYKSTTRRHSIDIVTLETPFSHYLELPPPPLPPPVPISAALSTPLNHRPSSRIINNSNNNINNSQTSSLSFSSLDNVLSSLDDHDDHEEEGEGEVEELEEDVVVEAEIDEKEQTISSTSPPAESPCLVPSSPPSSSTIPTPACSPGIPFLTTNHFSNLTFAQVFKEVDGQADDGYSNGHLLLKRMNSPSFLIPSPPPPTKTTTTINKDNDNNNNDNDNKMYLSPRLISSQINGNDEDQQQEPKILVIDDDPTSLKIFKNIISKRGYKCETAATAAIGLEMMEKKEFTMIFVDYQMPIMDGPTFSNKVRQEKHNSTVPIIAVTAHTPSEIRDSCLQAGMNDVYSKPIRKEDIHGLINKWAAVPSI